MMLPMLSRGLLLPLLFACASPALAQPAKKPAPAKPAPKKMTDNTARITGEKPGRPPLVRYEVEVKLHNTAKEARWFVLPSKLPATKTAGGVDAMEPRESKDVMLARFLGTGGFYAVKLAPGAKLTISKLELGVWGDDKPAEYPITIAKDITLGGKSAGTWFEHDPVAKGDAIDAVATSAGKAKKTPDGKEVPVVIDGEHVAVPLGN